MRFVNQSGLSSVGQEINIGYLFIYYYGLERHLLEGEFALAFDEILYLRSIHKNDSFLLYSGSALLYSSILRKRSDKIEYLKQNRLLIGDTSTELYLAYQLGHDLSVDSFIAISRHVNGVNRYYQQNQPEKYRTAVEACLIKRYGANTFPFAKQYKLDEMPKCAKLMFANVSFPSEIRNPEIPDFLKFMPLLDEILVICDQAHERVKEQIQAQRR